MVEAKTVYFSYSPLVESQATEEIRRLATENAKSYDLVLDIIRGELGYGTGDLICRLEQLELLISENESLSRQTLEVLIEKAVDYFFGLPVLKRQVVAPKFLCLIETMGNEQDDDTKCYIRPALNAKINSSTDSAREIDFHQLQLVSAHVKRVWEHEEAEKLYCEEIVTSRQVEGDKVVEVIRTIATGIRGQVPKEDFENKNVVIMANLKVRKLKGFPSHGMVMCAASLDKSLTEPVQALEVEVPLGDRLVLASYPDEKIPAAKPTLHAVLNNKHPLYRIYYGFGVDAAGLMTFDDKPLLFQKSRQPARVFTIKNGTVS